jgi:hypothetical protein
VSNFIKIFQSSESPISSSRKSDDGRTDGPINLSFSNFAKQTTKTLHDASFTEDPDSRQFVCGSYRQTHQCTQRSFWRSVPFPKLRQNEVWGVDLFCSLGLNRLQVSIVTVLQETESKYLALPYQNLSGRAVLSHVCYMFCPSIFNILIFEDNSSDSAICTFPPFFCYLLPHSPNTHYQVH